MIQRVRTQRRVEVMHQADVRGVVETLVGLQQSRFGDQLLRMFVTGIGQVNLTRFFIRPVVPLAFLGFLTLQSRHELIDAHIELSALFGRAGDDQRRAGLVDQNRVHFVDDRVSEPALRAILQPEREVVAQIVEAEFVVRAVGDVRTIGRALLFRRLTALDHAHRETEETIDRRHPVGVALRQVLVDGDDMHALGRQRIQIHRQRRHERLAFAGAHFGDLAVVQRHAADELDVEVPHAERTARGLARGCKCLRKKVVQCLALRETGAEFLGLRAQLLVAQRLEAGLQRIRAADVLEIPVDEPLIAAAEQLAQPVRHA